MELVRLLYPEKTLDLLTRIVGTRPTRVHMDSAYFQFEYEGRCLVSTWEWVFILGAGSLIAGAVDNDTFDWMDAWYAYRKREVKRGADERKPPVLRGDALYVEKTGTASAIIYWDGSTYRWFQQGD